SRGIAFRNDDLLLQDPIRYIAWYDDLGVTSSVPWTAIASAYFDAGGGDLIRQLEIFGDARHHGSGARVNIHATEDAATGEESYLALDSSVINSDGILGSYLEIGAREINLHGHTYVGIPVPGDVAWLHVKENSSTMDNRAGTDM